jgi:DNA-binding response OmpR family regulator
VRHAADGREALDQIRSFKPDILLVDFDLPGMDGLDVFHNLKPFLWQCGCILMTGNPRERLRESIARAGQVTLLEKPFSFAELDAAVADQILSPAYRRAQERRRPSNRRTAEQPASDGRHQGFEERRQAERRRDDHLRPAATSADAH